MEFLKLFIEWLSENFLLALSLLVMIAVSLKIVLNFKFSQKNQTIGNINAPNNQGVINQSNISVNGSDK